MTLPVRFSVIMASGTVAAGFFLALLAGEYARPLRTPTQSKARRVAISLAFATTGAAATALAYPPVVLSALRMGEHYRIGLLRWAHSPPALSALLAFVLLDYSLWIWHRLTHRVPLLWRFHAAHHADLDLDVLTAWRFHFGELLASVPFRGATVIAVGVDLGPLLFWEFAVLVCVQFHHSNVRLSARLEQVLRWVLVTPRLHGIHHSVETDDLTSNFGTILSVWDRLHRMHRWRIEPLRPVGLRQFRDARDVTLLRSLGLPMSRAPLPPPELT
jgi:sterol desaturase/sphingolipid hydroxylase (fatty acid hydroxylase superfamily)